MKCYNPVRISNFQYIVSAKQLARYFANGGLYLGNDNQSYYDKIFNHSSSTLYVPCRKCPACLRRRAVEWSGRLAREIDYYNRNGKKCAFVTLTYDNEHLPDANYKHDVAIFFDRLRSLLRRTIKHYCISELGDKRGRFHIHCILFDVDDKFAPDSHLWRDAHGNVHGSNSMLVERWQKGIVDTTMIKTIGAGVYIAGYLSKIKPQQNGELYVSPIIASNGIGYPKKDDVTFQFELRRIYDSLELGIIPYYEVGGKKYSYPTVFLNKYLDKWQKLRLAELSQGQLVANGGQFNVGTVYTNSYSEYTALLESYKSPLSLFNSKNYDSQFKKTIEQISFLDTEVFNVKKSSAVSVHSFAKTFAEIVTFKYFNLLQNYTPY